MNAGISIRTNPAWLVNKEAENPKDVRSICIYPNGDVLGDNIYRSDVMNIIKNYVPGD